MQQRTTLYAALVVAVLGLCLGAADIAFAGTNAKGCTTKLFFPTDTSQPVGILCANPGCPESCTIVPVASGQNFMMYVCTCPSNPGSTIGEHLVGEANNCTTFVEWDLSNIWQLSCSPDNCPSGCTTIPENLASGIAMSCQCAGGT